MSKLQFTSRAEASQKAKELAMEHNATVSIKKTEDGWIIESPENPRDQISNIHLDLKNIAPLHKRTQILKKEIADLTLMVEYSKSKMDASEVRIDNLKKKIDNQKIQNTANIRDLEPESQITKQFVVDRFQVLRQAKLGDSVMHKTRLEVGIGTVIELLRDKKCVVDFPSCRYSGLPWDSFILANDFVAKVLELKDQKERKYLLDVEENIEVLTKLNKMVSLESEVAERNNLEYINNCNLLKDLEKNLIIESFLEYGITSLWHMTHRANIASILRYGILNHYDAHLKRLNVIDISNSGVQQHRERAESFYNCKLHEYVPLYINQHNHMLSAVGHSHSKEDLCLLEISLEALSGTQYLLSDGNAAAKSTHLYNSLDNLDRLPWDVLTSDAWKKLPDKVRKRCSEVLIYKCIPARFINNIHCYSQNTVDSLSNCNHNVSLTKSLFD